MRIFGTRHSRIALLSLLAFVFPAVALCDATSVNGTCVYGDCTTPDSLSNSSTSSSTSNIINVGGSPFDVLTSFSATASGTSFNYSFGLEVVYVGTVPLPTTETVSIAFLQNFLDPNTTSWDGTYTFNDSENLSAGVSFTSNLLIDGQSVGPIGPFDGPGLVGGNGQATLTGLDGDTLLLEQLDSFTFAAGDDPGTGVNVPAPTPTPEPSSMLLLTTGLGLTVTAARRRFFRS
jgi:hypothetical protein